MMFQRGETVTRLRAPLVAGRGGNATQRDWEHAEQKVYGGVAVAPRTTSEPLEGGRTAVIVGLVLYLPPGDDTVASDRFLARGQLCEVEGVPGEWDNPWTGSQFGTEVALKAVAG